VFGLDPCFIAQEGNIMLAGIVFQLAAIIVYVGLASEFFIRWSLDKPVRTINDINPKGAEAGLAEVSSANITYITPDSERTVVVGGKQQELDRRARLMISGLAFSTLCILIRYAPPGQTTCAVTYSLIDAAPYIVSLSSVKVGTVVS
jgi:hypothetical protein